VHGWGGSPNEIFYQLIKRELELSGWKVFPLKMPNPDNPQIDPWVSTLTKNVSDPDKETYFYGHSVGCQTILRFLQDLPDNTEVGGAIFSAPWFHIKSETYEMEGEEETEAIVKPWLESRPDFNKIKTHCKKFIAIFSDNDPYVPLSDKDIFEKELNAKTLVEHNKDHFPGSDSGAVLDGIEEISRLQEPSQVSVLGGDQESDNFKEDS